jgi:iron(III) transport system ATP-binding protein
VRIALRGLSKRFGLLQVLSGLDADVGDGATLAVLGPSGSGKTTLLRLVAGLELPDDGCIELGGRVVSRRGWALEPHRRSVGFAFQSSALWPHMTVARNVSFGLDDRANGRRAARVGELLALLDLEGLADRYPDQLSGGQAKRVTLARALAPEPGCLLLDEPLASLEPALRERVLGVLRSELGRTGASAVYVTHDRAEAEALGSTVCALMDGRLQAAGALPDGWEGT